MTPKNFTRHLRPAKLNVSLLFLAITIITISACKESPGTGNKEMAATGKENTALSISGREVFTLADAEKILGEPAHITDSSHAKEHAITYNSTYTANSPEPKTGKTGNVYFMMENYSDIVDASKSYTSIRDMNEKNGIEELDDLGDEAYFHSDGQNFLFIMVRKGHKMFRIKVNKVTAKTSKDAFMLVAKDITSKI
jgi:hypothetical protein